MFLSFPADLTASILADFYCHDPDQCFPAICREAFNWSLSDPRTFSAFLAVGFSCSSPFPFYNRMVTAAGKTTPIVLANSLHRFVPAFCLSAAAPEHRTFEADLFPVGHRTRASPFYTS
jgi:hypothetical protein